MLELDLLDELSLELLTVLELLLVLPSLSLEDNDELLVPMLLDEEFDDEEEL